MSPDQGSNPVSCTGRGFFTTEPPGKPLNGYEDAAQPKINEQIQ